MTGPELKRQMVVHGIRVRDFAAYMGRDERTVRTWRNVADETWAVPRYVEVCLAAYVLGLVPLEPAPSAQPRSTPLE